MEIKYLVPETEETFAHAVIGTCVDRAKTFHLGKQWKDITGSDPSFGTCSYNKFGIVVLEYKDELDILNKALKLIKRYEEILNEDPTLPTFEFTD